MEVLFIFFKWVASFSHVDEETGSKMDLHNLAIIMTILVKVQVLVTGTYEIYVIICSIRHILNKETMKIKMPILLIYIQLHLQLSIMKVQFQLNNEHLDDNIYIILFIYVCIYLFLFS